MRASSPPHPSAAPTPSPQGEGRAAGRQRHTAKHERYVEPVPLGWAAAPTVGWLPRAIQLGLAVVGGGLGRSRAPPLRIKSLPVCTQRTLSQTRHRVRRAGSSRPTQARCGVPFTPGCWWAEAMGRTESSAPTDGLLLPCAVQPGVGGGWGRVRAEQSPAPTDKVAACLQPMHPFSNPSPGTARRGRRALRREEAAPFAIQPGGVGAVA